MLDLDKKIKELKKIKKYLTKLKKLGVDVENNNTKTYTHVNIVKEEVVKNKVYMCVNIKNEVKKDVSFSGINLESDYVCAGHKKTQLSNNPITYVKYPYIGRFVTEVKRTANKELYDIRQAIITLKDNLYSYVLEYEFKGCLKNEGILPTDVDDLDEYINKLNNELTKNGDVRPKYVSKHLGKKVAHMEVPCVRGTCYNDPTNMGYCGCDLLNHYIVIRDSRNPTKYDLKHVGLSTDERGLKPGELLVDYIGEYLNNINNDDE